MRGLERVAVDMADVRFHRTDDRPCNFTVLFERSDRNGDVVDAEWIVVECFAIHVDLEGVPDCCHRVARSVEQHARAVDVNVSIWIAQQLKDRRRVRCDGSLDFDSFVAHLRIMAFDRRPKSSAEVSIRRFLVRHDGEWDDGPAVTEEIHVKYMLLIYGDNERLEKLPDAEKQGWMGEYFGFSQTIVESGEMVAGDPLHGVDTATTLTIRAGERLVTDGPFAETKETLGGYYIVDVADLDRALELAAMIPDARTGKVEVRPIMDMAAEMPA